MRRSVVLVAALVLAAGACRSSHEPPSATTTSSPPRSGGDPAPGPTAPVPTGGTAGPDIVTLLANNVRLFDSEASDNAFRILVDSSEGDVAVVVHGIPTPNRTILVCPATELDRQAPRATCTTPADGQPARLPHRPTYQGVEVMQVGVTGTGPAGGSTAVPAIAVTYTPSSREVRVRLPPLRAGRAGEPASFRLSPAGSSGAYRATAVWGSSTPTSAGTAELSLLAGEAPTARSEGGPGVALSGTVSSPAEATLRIRNTGTSTLTGLTLTALLP